jgi:serine phosphatase RsbU (regulator of sigma subunit)
VDPQTGAPAWAQAGFDDSAWETVDLTPKNGVFNSWSGSAGYAAGWKAKGHAEHWGYAWYRIRLQLETRPGEALALAGPNDVDDAYQVFDNGRLVGSFGDFRGATPVTYYAQPMMFQLPPVTSGAGDGGEPGSTGMVLAFRVWMGPNSALQLPDAGGMHNAPLLGDAAAVEANYVIRWQKLLRAYMPLALEALIYLLLAVMAYSLTMFDHADRVYVWVGTVVLLMAVDYALSAVTFWTTYLSFLLPTMLRDDFLTPLVSAGWVMVWWIWFRLHRPAWVPRAVDMLTVLLMLANMLSGSLFSAYVSRPVATAFPPIALGFRLLLFALLVWVVVLAIQRKGVEGWVVLPTVVLWGLGQFQKEHSSLHFQTGASPIGLEISVAQIANLLMAGVIAWLLLRRLLRSLHEQRLMAEDINLRLVQSGQEQLQMALDVKQAQEVQLVILPEARTVLPGLVIESEYRPARAVGGDFFQIVPRPLDGSLLIVAGDVTGKGLKASMMVAFLVGAIRSTVDWTADPSAVLKALNHRLRGRGDAQATCLALRIGADGSVLLANAGHLPPYLNGEPLEMEGALPLGMRADVDLSVMRFKLAEGDRLVLMSDGIVEAQDIAGNLFGFERAHELLRKAKTAAEVAIAAQNFGQEDDISVISVTRTAVSKPAVA